MSKKTQFTWEELSSLNTQQNAHVAVREKVIFKRSIYIISNFRSTMYQGRDL